MGHRGQRESSLELVPQGKLSVIGARDDYPIGRTNKINDGNDNKHKAITIAME